VRLIFIFDAFGMGTPSFGTFGHRNASGRGYFGNFLADGSRTSGPPQSSSVSSKMVDELWVDTKFHPPASEEHPRFPLVIPESVVNYELEEAHDKPTAYHFGVKRTLDTIRKRFY